ncbi:hypothetical protein BUALT_Bualt04G0061100 [Buddleja alternifolia]|uniref:Transcriptional coactivator p15 (PC4) C-terminal domain-containing protein n=1 Tax=Buddleja alternifolia TaxID=168488 RepID=A0AAV6XN19_9LAMI|nr:hypothetical protein BUALT_Bualt04G0061100 [Buddleja alternifolia]
MSKRGKKKEDEVLSETDEPPKKSLKPDDDDSDDSDNIFICELSKNRKVSVRSWQGKVVVDIREFYVKDGKEFPGKKGAHLFFIPYNIAININLFALFITLTLLFINQATLQLSVRVGLDGFAEILYNFPNELSHILKKIEFEVGARLFEVNLLGISLSMDQWKILRDHVDEIDEEVA